jgi:hypothetical protein
VIKRLVPNISTIRHLTVLSLLGASLTTAQIQSAQAQTASIGLNFTGLTDLDSGFIPPDTMLAVGDRHLVEMVNGGYALFDKATGDRQSYSTLSDFWLNAGVSLQGSVSDPRVIFDPGSGRWFATAIDLPASLKDNNLLLAVSKGADPNLGWTGFTFLPSGGNSSFADFPTLGVTGDGVFLSTRQFGTEAVIPKTLIALPKNDLLAAEPSVSRTQYFYNLTGGGDVLYPVSSADRNVANILSLDSSSGQLFNQIFDGRSPSPAQPVGSPLGNTAVDRPRQPNGSRDLEIEDDRLASDLRQVGDSIWSVWVEPKTVESRSPVLRWTETSAKGQTLKQSGRIESSDLLKDYFYPSIAANDQGDVVIGFNQSGTNEFISSYAVVGATENGSTRFGQPLQLKAGNGNYQQTFGGNRNRWGDYSTVVLDPSDPLSFWTAQEYVASENRWATQITQIKIDRNIAKSPEPGAILALSGLAARGLKQGLRPRPKQGSRC